MPYHRRNIRYSNKINRSGSNRNSSNYNNNHYNRNNNHYNRNNNQYNGSNNHNHNNEDSNYYHTGPSAAVMAQIRINRKNNDPSVSSIQVFDGITKRHQAGIVLSDISYRLNAKTADVNSLKTSDNYRQLTTSETYAVVKPHLVRHSANWFR